MISSFLLFGFCTKMITNQTKKKKKRPNKYDKHHMTVTTIGAATPCWARRRGMGSPDIKALRVPICKGVCVVGGEGQSLYLGMCGRTGMKVHLYLPQHIAFIWIICMVMAGN